MKAIPERSDQNMAEESLGISSRMDIGDGGRPCWRGEMNH